MFRSPIRTLLVSLAAVWLAALPAASQTFSVSFNTFSGPDCVKNKFGVYQTPFMGTGGLPPLTSMAPFLADAGVHDLRYEMGIGKSGTYAYTQVGGTADAPSIDFTQLDPFVTMLATNGIAPLFAVTYCPLPLQTSSWQDTPGVLSSWQSMVEQYAAHYSSVLGVKGVRYEMWNEPDLSLNGSTVFFDGNQSDYGEIYQYGAAGGRAGAGDALVGGPAIAYDTSYVTESGMLNQPMDFGSIHAYANASGQISDMASALGGKDVPIYLTEYASYTSFTASGPNSTHAAAGLFFQDVKLLLAYSNVTKVYWAQWVDDNVGMITYSLHKKAIYNAYKIYQTLLPTLTVAVNPVSYSGGVDTLAASDGYSADGEATAGIVAWNTNTTDAAVTIDLNNLPGGTGTLQLYRIDSQDASYIDHPSTENLAVNSQWSYSTPSNSWSGTIPAQSLVFILATAAPGLETAYGGSPWLVPGAVQAENFDNGGEGIAYHSDNSSNLGGQYRTKDSVGIEICTDTGGGYDVGWTAPGQWLKYTVNVQSAGKYNVAFRVSSGASGGSFHLQDQNGNNLTGSIVVPGTGAWQDWTTVNATATLSAGVQTIELYEDTSGFNFNYLTFSLPSPPSAPATPVGLTAGSTGDGRVQLAWDPSTNAAYYNLSRALAAAGPYTNVVSQLGTNYTDSAVVVGTTYYYVVAATNSTGSSANSAPVNVTPSLTPVGSLVFSQQPSNTVAGATLSEVDVTASDQDAPVTNATVILTVASGTGSLNGAVKQVTDTNGLARFTQLSLTVAGAKTLGAVCRATNAASAPFNILAASATELVWSIEPGLATNGLVFAQQPLLQSADQFGNLSTTGLPAILNVTVNLTAGTGPLAGTTTGNIGATGGNGSLTFTNLQINSAGDGQVLTAAESGGQLASATAVMKNRYSFDGVPGSTTVVDSAGGQNGQLLFYNNSAPYTNGALDGSAFGGNGTLTLAGGNGYVALPSSGLVHTLASGAVTFEAWVQELSTQNSQAIFDFGMVQSGAVNQKGTEQADIEFCPFDPNGPNGYPRGEAVTANRTTVNGVDGTLAFPISTNSPVYYAVIYDPQTSHVFSYYTNASPAFAATGVATPLLSAINDQDAWLGQRIWTGAPATNPNLHGIYDEFRIWDGVLSAGDIAAHYAAGPNQAALSNALSAPFSVYPLPGQPTNRLALTNNNNGIMSLGLTGIPGRSYYAETATSLVPPVVWTPLSGSTNVASTNGLWHCTDTNPQTSERFYRAVAQ